MSLAIVLLALAAQAAGGAAQSEGPPAVRLPLGPLIARECAPQSRQGEIVVCGRQEDEDERYRLPLVRNQRFDPEGAVDSVSRERNRLLQGSSAPLGSCSTVGPGGMTGCFGQGVWARREQRGR